MKFDKFIVLGLILIVGVISVNSYNFTENSVSIEGVSKSNFLLEVSKGNVAGHSHINKFGHNPTADAGDDIWGGDGVYAFYPDTAKEVDIVSTSAQDDVGGTGAIQINVQGLNADWELQSETVTLNGTNPVNLTYNYTRLFRAYVVEAGSSNSNVGDISVEIRNNDTVGAFIGASGGQTQQCIYTIPANKKAYFLQGYVALGTSDKTAQNGVFRWLMRFNDGFNGAWLTQGEVGLVNLGNSYWKYKYAIPAGPIPEKTDIRIELQEASAQFDTVCGFDLLLVDDGY